VSQDRKTGGAGRTAARVGKREVRGGRGRKSFGGIKDLFAGGERAFLISCGDRPLADSGAAADRMEVARRGDGMGLVFWSFGVGL